MIYLITPDGTFIEPETISEQLKDMKVKKVPKIEAKKVDKKSHA